MGEMKDLYVSTTRSLLRLDLKNYNFDPLLESGEPPPQAAVSLEYGKNYPYGLRVIKSSRSKIYMVGEKTTGYSCTAEVHEFDPIANSLQKANISLRGSKSRPIVAEIDGKIYVLEAARLYHQPAKTFEVFDPCSSSEDSICEVLADPPFYTDCYKSSSSSSSNDDDDHKHDDFDVDGYDNDDRPDRVAGHFVLGHKLYILTFSYKLYHYDTKRRLWGREEDMLKYFCRYLGCSWLIPTGGTTVCGGDVILAFQEQADYDPCSARGIREIMDLFGYLYSKDGCLLGYQNLGNVFSVRLYSTRYHVFAMEDGKVCALLFGYNLEIPALRENLTIKCLSTPVRVPFQVLAVSIFSVVKLCDAARALQDKAPCMPLSADAPLAAPHHLTDYKEHESTFLSLEIESQYIFQAEDGRVAHLLGAFFP
ncbi:hypothetical protein DM860_010759 [Cuscuta australis]|uniref:Uncharacterized protein n=1 Tax=Cuscuta australis TaxID=267555 RepID=A0A328DZY9_9ASTE|nr:hypothetical protein DM860_010759 [Cuscuta australis]